jgi:hypothetical protein
MRPIVFVDTSAWLALVNRSDSFHFKAKETRDTLLKNKAKSFVTDFVIVEVANCLSRVPFRSSAIKLVNFIKTAEDIELVKIEQEIFDEAWNLYCSHQDKEWSFTDCTSIMVMNRKGIREAFSTDHHFEQAGFTILLKE